MADFSKIPPGATLRVQPFRAHVDEQKLKDFITLVRLSPIAPKTYENSHSSVDRRYGVSRDWLINARDHWLKRFDWRRHEERINSFPNFTADVKDDLGNTLTVHFVALFSQRSDALPIVLLHGWPGSFLEFLQILDLLRSRYSPQNLPYHIIVPSLPGYAYSSGPPLDSDYAISNASAALNNLMVGLGMSGYVAQGGDLGAFISRELGLHFPECKGIHLNMALVTSRPRNVDQLHVDPVEQRAMPRGQRFIDTGRAYALEHGTRTATIGHSLSASPVALLSWIGEKFLEWSDEDPPLDLILESVTLYWMTDTLPRCLYPYRGLTGDDERPRMAKHKESPPQLPFIAKPSGYSFFPKELMPTPRSWAATKYNLVSTALHTSGGHFAAMEKPKELWQDVEEYIAKAFPTSKL